jgi:hypothetical protein
LLSYTNLAGSFDTAIAGRRLNGADWYVRVGAPPSGEKLEAEHNYSVANGSLVGLLVRPGTH